MVEELPLERSRCAISRVLDRLGDKWSLLIIRDLLFHQKHQYLDFLQSQEKIATNILSQRLKRLCELGLIAETRHPQFRSRKLYYLTEQGKDLLPILVEMSLWADKHLPDSEVPISKAESLKFSEDARNTPLDQ